MRRRFVPHEFWATLLSCLTVLSSPCLAPELAARAQGPAATQPADISPCPLQKSSKLPVNPNKSGGVRGTQKLRFVVTSGGTDIEHAVIEIRNKDCKLVKSGKTDDWGEYYAPLDPGSYHVSVSWRELRIQRLIHVDANTKDVRVPLDDK